MVHRSFFAFQKAPVVGIHVGVGGSGGGGGRRISPYLTSSHVVGEICTVLCLMIRRKGSESRGQHLGRWQTSQLNMGVGGIMPCFVFSR